MKYFVVPIILIITFNLVFSQQKDQKLSEIFRDAEYYRLYEKYSEALPLYQKLIQEGHDKAHINYRIGECYLEMSGAKERAIPFLEKATQNIDRKFREGSFKETEAPVYAIFHLGKAYQINNQLDKALKTYNKFLENIDKKNKDEFNMNFVEKQIQSCKNAKELIDDPSPVTFYNVGGNVNTLQANIRPVTNHNQTRLVYASKLKFYDGIFMSEKNDEEWDEPVNLTPQIKSDGNFLPGSLNKKGNKLILLKSGRYKGDLYLAEYDKEDKEWKEPDKLSNINTNNWETHGHLCNDGQTIYFTSNRKGGRGGLDIYVSHYDEAKQEWGTPENLGENINTPYNEETPFLTEDGKKLYFSSQGHYGMGGFDIFYAEKLDNGDWSEPVNIGYPINTTDDDLFYQPINNGKSGYMPRCREDGFGDYDIYRIDYTPEDTISKVELKGIIYPPHGDKIPPEQVAIKIQDTEDSDDRFTSEITDSLSFFVELIPGEYKILIDDKEEKYQSIEKTISVGKDYKRKTYPISFNLRPESLDIQDSLKVQNIYFRFNDYAIPDSSKAGLDNLIEAMKQYPDINLEITGHTDSIGNQEYNKRLSSKRAQSVITYLKKNGIPEDRMTLDAKGEDYPIAINTLQNGKDCPEGRQYNRRVEIIPVSSENSYIIENTSKIPSELKKRERTFYSIFLLKEERQLQNDYFRRYPSLQDYTIKEYSNGKYFYFLGEFKDQGDAIGAFKEALKAGFSKAHILPGYKIQDIIKLSTEEVNEKIINQQ